MGAIEHAGTAKAMPAIRTDDEATAAPATATDNAAPVIKTSDEAGQVAGEIVTEPTAKTMAQPGADKIAAERGMPPLRVPDKP